MLKVFPFCLLQSFSKWIYFVCEVHSFEIWISLFLLQSQAKVSERGFVSLFAFFFFFLLGHDLGRRLDLNLVGLNGARRGESRPREKNPFDKWVVGLDLRVRSGYEKTRPKPHRLPFLVMRGKLVIRQGGADLASTVKTILVTKWRKKNTRYFQRKRRKETIVFFERMSYIFPHLQPLPFAIFKRGTSPKH